MMRFSIVTITFNAAAVLERTLDSVLTQTWPHVEHLIVDGASTDGTVAMAERYRQRSAKEAPGHEVTVLSEPDRGLYDAMNKGLALATGDYVLFLNAGDSLPGNGTLELVAGRVKALGDDKALWPAVLYGDTNIVDGDGRYLRPRHLSAPCHLSWRSFRRGMVVCHQAFYARLDIARRTPYDLDFRFSADVDWCIRVMKKAEQRHLPLLNVHAVVANYMEEGQSTLHHKASLKERFYVMVRHYGYVSTVLMHVWFAGREMIRRLSQKF